MGKSYPYVDLEISVFHFIKIAVCKLIIWHFKKVSLR